MISIELKKRITTSLLLLILLISMYYYFYILIIFLLLVTIISWIEFNGLIVKIFKSNNLENKLFKFLLKSVSLLYLSLFSFVIIFVRSENLESEIFIIYSLFVSINSDIGGLLFGKIFKGRKLTKISPGKTVSGSIGSFIFSLALIPYFLQYFDKINIPSLIIITILVSFTSQLGDLFFSFLKRKAKVKNTSDLLPGHGGFIDRIDGILFAVPIGFLLFRFI
jgi:phosphatidate cytidylyltransferase